MKQTGELPETTYEYLVQEVYLPDTDSQNGLQDVLLRSSRSMPGAEHYDTVMLNPQVFLLFFKRTVTHLTPVYEMDECPGLKES